MTLQIVGVSVINMCEVSDTDCIQLGLLLKFLAVSVSCLVFMHVPLQFERYGIKWFYLYSIIKISLKLYRHIQVNGKSLFTTNQSLLNTLLEYP